jgi:hypothetical protein
VVFSFTSFNNGGDDGFWDEYSGPGGPYNQPAPTPAMPWKDNPTHGIIIGNVVDANTSEPIVDARVTRNGSAYKALTSGDGLYSFLLVPPGSYVLTFTKSGYSTRRICNVTVAAGEVKRVDTTLGGPFVPGDFDGNDIVDLADFQPFIDCILGPTVNYPPGHCCRAGDADQTSTVDLRDAALIGIGGP